MKIFKKACYIVISCVFPIGNMQLHQSCFVCPSNQGHALVLMGENYTTQCFVDVYTQNIPWIPVFKIQNFAIPYFWKCGCTRCLEHYSLLLQQKRIGLRGDRIVSATNAFTRVIHHVGHSAADHAYFGTTTAASLFTIHSFWHAEKQADRQTNRQIDNRGIDRDLFIFQQIVILKSSLHQIKPKSPSNLSLLSQILILQTKVSAQSQLMSE